MKRNLLIFFACILLCLFGLIMVYSSSNVWSLYKYNDSFYYVKHQGIFFLIGLILILIIKKIDYNLYKKYASIIFLISILLLILVLIPGIGKIRNGSRSWFGIGALGLQPSELSKLAIIIFTAKYLSDNEKDIIYFKKGILPILLIIFLFFGLIMLEPDFGTSMVMVMTCISMLFISNIKFSFFGIIGLLGLIGIVCLIIIAPYRMARIVSFLNPWTDPLGSGFQIIQSLFAISPYGLFGRGFGGSIQKHFYLPEPQTDFIFSIISEEFGIMGIIIVLTLFYILFKNTIKISLNSNNLFGKYLSFGLIMGIMIQMVLNIAVVIGLVPVTGVTLPFISYGGSSLLTSMISIGIILNISKNT